MRLNHIWVIVLISGLACAAPSIANPILLATYEYHVEGGTASDHAPSEPWAVAFILQLGFYDWEQYPEVRALGAEVQWRVGDAGTVTLDAENCGAFTDFAEYATNGLEDQIRFWDLAVGLGGNGSAFIPEPQVFNSDPDFIGHRLTTVDLTVDSLDFEPWSPPWAPDLEGFLYSGDITWKFYGVPVPEPSNVVLALVATWVLSRRSERRARGMRERYRAFRSARNHAHRSI